MQSDVITTLGSNIQRFSTTGDHKKFLMGLSEADLVRQPVKVLAGRDGAPRNALK